MTEKQKRYIKWLDYQCMRKRLPIRAIDEDMLGKDWEEVYKNITIDYAGEIIAKLHNALGIENKPLPKKGGRKHEV